MPVQQTRLPSGKSSARSAVTLPTCPSWRPGLAGLGARYRLTPPCGHVTRPASRRTCGLTSPQALLAQGARCRWLLFSSRAETVQAALL